MGAKVFHIFAKRRLEKCLVLVFLALSLLTSTKTVEAKNDDGSCELECTKSQKGKRLTVRRIVVASQEALIGRQRFLPCLTTLRKTCR